MSNVLDLVDQTFFLGERATGVTAVLQCVSVLGIHTMSMGAPILLEELNAMTDRHDATAGQVA